MFERKKPINAYALTVGVVVLVVLAGGIWYWKNNYESRKVVEPSPTAVVIVEEKKLSPVETVDLFCETFFMSVLPQEEQNYDIKEAFNLLSENAKKSITEKDSDETIGLLNFAKVNTVPNNGFIIKGVSEVEDRATVEVLWDYSGRQTSKIFNLVLENGYWKIDTLK